jgi:hypothetical protein
MKLNETQLILLATAANRDNGSPMPLPDTVTAPADRVRKAIAALLKSSYIEEGEVQDASLAWRMDGEAHIGIRIGDAGRIAIGAGEPLAAQAAPGKKQTKTAMVLALLLRGEGATLAELISATGWQPHTTRAALTGLRKKDHKIEKGKRGEETFYSIASAA